eukprot:3112572-Rhodomonas_salina.6
METEQRKEPAEISLAVKMTGPPNVESAAVQGSVMARCHVHAVASARGVCSQGQGSRAERSGVSDGSMPVISDDSMSAVSGGWMSAISDGWMSVMARYQRSVMARCQ